MQTPNTSTREIRFSSIFSIVFGITKCGSEIMLQDLGAIKSILCGHTYLISKNIVI